MTELGTVLDGKYEILKKAIEETLAYLKSMHEDIEDIRILTKDQNDIFRGRLNRPRAIEQSSREG